MQLPQQEKYCSGAVTGGVFVVVVVDVGVVTFPVGVLLLYFCLSENSC